jgi:hypothetical protein
MLVVLLMASGACAAVEPALPPMQWRQVPADELSMTAEPAAPGAAAVYLYTEVNQRPARSTEQVYRQIKVLTEKGRDLANITVEYRKLLQTISDFEARVIQPDGTVIPYRDKIYERELVAAEFIGGLYAKTIALPEVRVGSIIEYRYTVTSLVSSASQYYWTLNQDLFTRLARFSNRPIGNMQLRLYVPQGWPKGTTPARLEDDGAVRMEARNLPAFEEEEFMPPAVNLTQRVEFAYSGPSNGATDFWQEAFRQVNVDFERGMKPSSALRKTVDGIVKVGDTDEQKVRKLYEHVRGIPNTEFEAPLSEKEISRRSRFNQPVQQFAEVGKRGFGNSRQLVLYFVALLRTAGLQAQPVLVGARWDRFFEREARRLSDLSGTLASVQLGDRELLLDPSVPLLPFGSLSWFHTAVDAVKLDATGGQWMEIPGPTASEATIRREASLKLDADGVLDGSVSVTFTGHAAVALRMAMLNVSTDQRREVLEAELKSHLPPSAAVKLVGQPDWTGMGTPLQAKFQMTVKDWVASSGSRLLVGLGVFGGREKGVFVTENRRHPIYFQYPYESEDLIRIEYPAGYHLESAPSSPPLVDPLLRYSTSVETADNAVVMHRMMGIGVVLAPASAYPSFRSFFQSVRGGDEQQVLLVR